MTRVGAPSRSPSAAAAGSAWVPVADWPERTWQPSGHILEVLTRRGAVCSPTADGMRVAGAGTIHGITADLRDVPELVPVLTALAALADSPSAFTGIGHMRRHDSDRLAALAAEIGAPAGGVPRRRVALASPPRRH